MLEIIRSKSRMWFLHKIAEYKRFGIKLFVIPILPFELKRSPTENNLRSKIHENNKISAASEWNFNLTTLAYIFLTQHFFCRNVFSPSQAT